MFVLLYFVMFMMISSSYGKSLPKTDGHFQLRLVQVVFRHGDRNPVSYFYPNDPYKNESYWPEGYAQLTKRGKQQHYALGKWLRQRYGNFLSDSYSPYEIFIQASDVDRTLMSAEADMAGLYPPNPSDPVSVWNNDLAWQPIPVHTIPKEIDNKIRMSAHCPRWEQMNTQFNHGPEMEHLYHQNKELFEYLEEHAGKKIRTLNDVKFLYDSLEIESLHGYKLPNWTEKVFPGGPFYDLTALSFKQFTWYDEMKRLKVGPLVKELTDNLQKKGGSNPALDPRMKMLVYSGHDTTIASLLNSLSIWNGIPPPYASAVLLELSEQDGSFFVEILYRNDTTREPYLLNLPGCRGSCPLEEFIALSKNVVPHDWKKECTAQS